MVKFLRENILLLIALIACIVISTGSFVWGYQLAGYESLLRWIAALGFLWIMAAWLRWRWFHSPVVLLALGLAGFGVWFEFGGGWMFNGAVFALFAWNLAEFDRKLKSLLAREQSEIPSRTRRHILRISLLVLAGFLVEAFFLLIRGQFSKEWGLAALGILIFGSLQALAWRR